jgi:hypothetical protein
MRELQIPQIREMTIQKKPKRTCWQDYKRILKNITYRISTKQLYNFWYLQEIFGLVTSDVCYITGYWQC